MRSKASRGIAIAAVIGAALVLGTSGISTVAGQAATRYTVEITNLTHGQPFTPPLLVAHTDGADLFEMGTAASAELQQIAENGNLDPAVALLDESSAVIDAVVGEAPIMPGQTATLTIEATEGSLLSWVSMLICTNDGFTGIDSLALPASGSEMVSTNAYDAGTEMNTEDFKDMVPPCQPLVGVSSPDTGTGMSNPDLAEGGVVAAHAGVKGGNDLTASHMWNDPVASVKISVAPAGLPATGSGDLGQGSGSTLPYLAAIGMALVALSGALALGARRAAAR